MDVDVKCPGALAHTRDEQAGADQPDTRWESIDFRDTIPYSAFVAALSVSGDRPFTFCFEMKIAKSGWFWWAVAIVVYLGSYLILRINDVFVHRAGNYADKPPYYAGPTTNHFIEPGEYVSEDLYYPELPVSPDSDYDPFSGERPQEWEDYYEVYHRAMDARKQIENQIVARGYLFGFFFPAAFAETWFWKLVDPYPTKRQSRTSRRWQPDPAPSRLASVIQNPNLNT